MEVTCFSTGAQAMLVIDPSNKDKALGYVIDLSDRLSGRSIKVPLNTPVMLTHLYFLLLACSLVV